MGQKVSRSSSKLSHSKSSPNSSKSAYSMESMLLELQSRAIKQYPWLAEGVVSCTVTDNSLPDNPIVWVNDEFERMTLYSKEEILGKNCRFLQGKSTSRETVASIKNCVIEGKELEVEILNYRKDGVPFWNKFRILPVYSNDRKIVTHFIAVQRDVTYLKETGSTPAKWTPPEVGMWLEHIGYGRYSKVIIDENIDGQELLAISSKEMVKSLRIRSKDAHEIRRHAKLLMRSPSQAFSGNAEEYSSGSSYSSDEKEFVKRPSFSPTPSKNRRNSQQMSIYEKIAVKCYLDEEIRIFLVLPESPLKSFLKTLKNTMHCKFELESYEDETLVTPVTWQQMLKNSNGETVRVNLRPKETIDSLEAALFDDMTDPIVLLRKTGRVLFMNEAAAQALGYHNLADDSSVLFQRIVPSFVDPFVGVQTTTVLHKDGEKLENARLSMSLSKRGFYIATLALSNSSTSTTADS